MRPGERSRVGKSPSARRCLLVLGMTATLWHSYPRGAVAGPEAEALTEAEAVRRGLSRPAVADRAAGEIGLARSEAIQAGLWPNPTASWAREQTRGGSAGSTEDYAWLTQSFDLVGRRALRRRAGNERIDAALAGNEARRIEIVAETRLRFYETLQAQRKVEALQAWSRETERVARIVARREAAGEVSGYDRRRLERERAGAAARLRAEQAAFARARERLAAVVDGEARPEAREARLEGELLPPEEVPPLDELLVALPARADLRALERSAAAADLDVRAAGRWWVPELTVQGGLKTVETVNDRVSGFIAGVSVPLPLLDRSQADAVRAASRGLVARAEGTLERDRAAAEVRGLWRESSELAGAARRLRADAGSASADLVRTAEAAYEGGEMEILELLDAHRTALDAQLQALDFELSARRARIELDRATGGGL